MKAEITVEIKGRKRRLAMPIGACAEVAKVNKYPVELYEALCLGKGSQQEIVAVLDAGAKHGDDGDGGEAIAAAVGWIKAAQIARDLWSAACLDDSGNSDAAGKSENAGGSTSVAGSSAAP